MRVAIVDDMLMIRKVYTYVFQRIGVEAEGFADGWSFLRSHMRFDAISLGFYNNDGLNGDGVLRELAAGNITIPVVVVTGWVGNESIAYNLGARAFLNKPVLPRDLVATVAQITGDLSGNLERRLAAEVEASRRRRETRQQAKSSVG